MRQITIFYADDDIDDLNLCKEAAEEFGHRVEIFFSGDELLDALATAEPTPDIILLDYYMPRSGGLETMEEIRRLHPEIPVVMITGLCSDVLRQQFKDQGAADVFEKPYTIREQEVIVDKIVTQVVKE